MGARLVCASLECICGWSVECAQVDVLCRDVLDMLWWARWHLQVVWMQLPT